jgi:OmpA-OmpF porin, OOP family
MKTAAIAVCRGHATAAWAAALLVLSGCAAPPASRVILLPGGESRPTGGVSVTTLRGQFVLDKPLAQVLVARDGSLEPGQASADEVRQRYADLLAQQPARPRLWTVYFESNSDRLVPDSQAVLAEVREAWRNLPHAELVLTGHTDRVGGAGDNDKLSLQRANALRDLLVAAGFAAESMRVAGRGEREPLVSTADEVAEPRNRRVEIKLR